MVIITFCLLKKYMEKVVKNEKKLKNAKKFNFLQKKIA